MSSPVEWTPLVAFTSWKSSHCLPGMWCTINSLDTFRGIILKKRDFPGVNKSGLLSAESKNKLREYLLILEFKYTNILLSAKQCFQRIYIGCERWIKVYTLRFSNLDKSHLHCLTRQQMVVSPPKPNQETCWIFSPEDLVRWVIWTREEVSMRDGG